MRARVKKLALEYNQTHPVPFGPEQQGSSENSDQGKLD
jgi:hypothetical protein